MQKPNDLLNLNELGSKKSMMTNKKDKLKLKDKESSTKKKNMRNERELKS
jgi:hypothetical protein